MNNPTVKTDTAAAATSVRYALCISNDGDRLSVLKGKVYRVLPPARFDRDHDLRVVDETGDDYLYDQSWFVEINLPPAPLPPSPPSTRHSKFPHPPTR